MNTIALFQGVQGPDWTAGLRLKLVKANWNDITDLHLVIAEPTMKKIGLAYMHPTVNRSIPAAAARHDAAAVQAISPRYNAISSYMFPHNHAM